MVERDRGRCGQSMRQAHQAGALLCEGEAGTLLRCTMAWFLHACSTDVA